MDTNKRINRIVGQLRGVERMIVKRRDCKEVLQQVSAIKKAIDSLSQELVIDNICRLVPKNKVKKVEQIVERAINL